MDVHTRSSVAAIEGQSRTERLKLTDGTTIETDVVLVGLGGKPATNWLQTSGVPLRGGLQVTSDLRIPGFPQLFGAGDIANVRDEHGGFSRREHWAAASHRGALAARTLLRIRGGLGREEPPSFWTDQYDAKLQEIGTTTGADRRVLLGGDLHGDCLLLGYLRQGRLIGAVSVTSRKALSALRDAVVSRLPLEAAA